MVQTAKARASGANAVKPIGPWTWSRVSRKNQGPSSTSFPLNQISAFMSSRKKTQSPSLRNYKTQNPFAFKTPNTLKSHGKGRTRGHSSTIIIGVTNSQQLNVSTYIQKPEDTTINKYEDTTATAKLESAMLGGSQETYE